MVRRSLRGVSAAPGSSRRQRTFVTLTATTSAGTTSNASAEGTATITDDDDAPTLTVSSPTVAESGFAEFTVSLSNPSAGDITVDLALADDTATGGGVDYGTGGLGNLQVFDGTNWVDATTATFAAGETSVLVRTPISTDTIFEGDETFTLTATTSAGTTSNASAEGTATITDDDDAPTLTVSSPTVAESGFAEFTVSLSNPSAGDITVDLALADDTATGGGVDYGTGGLGNLQVFDGTNWVDATTATFAAGETSVLVRTPISTDTIDEGDETFTLTATTSAGTTSNASAEGTATITDDDDAPTLTVSSPTVAESGFAEFTVSLSNPSAGDITVDLALADDTATGGGVDYGTGGLGNLQVFDGTNWVDATTATFAAGETSVLVRTPISTDTIVEGDETFTLTATTSAGTTSNASAQGTATITNDDEAPPVLDLNGTGAGGNSGFDYTTTFTAGGPAKAIADIDVSISDLDDTYLEIGHHKADQQTIG